MRSAIAVFGVLLAWPSLALAIECREWDALDGEGRSARIRAMIEGHLSSNVGKRYTSENQPAMRRCLERFVDEIADQFDGACAGGRSTAKNELDQIFDRYFLSCVQ